MNNLTPDAIEKLQNSKNIWFGSVRPDGRPHLTPVWFVFWQDHLFVSIDPKSIKRKNITQNPNVVLALEEGNHPVICEGRAKPIQPPYAEEMLALFQQKYDWDINGEAQYNVVVEVLPQKWLVW